MTAPMNQNYWGQQQMPPQQSNFNLALNYQQNPSQPSIMMGGYQQTMPPQTGFQQQANYNTYPQQQMFNPQSYQTYQNPMGINSAFPGTSVNLNLNASGNAANLNNILGLLGLGGGNTAGLSGIVELIKQTINGNLNGTAGQSTTSAAELENENQIDTVDFLSNDFATYDSNGDGVVSAIEIKALLEDGEDADGDEIDSDIRTGLMQLATTKELAFAGNSSEEGDTGKVSGVSQKDLASASEYLQDDEKNTFTTMKTDIAKDMKDKWDVSSSKTTKRLAALGAETEAQSYLSGNFDEIDANSDGIISKDEIQDAIDEGEDEDGNPLSSEVKLALTAIKSNLSDFAKASTETNGNTKDSNTKLSKTDLDEIAKRQNVSETFEEILKDLD